jgi:histidine ammonia-lyase
MNSATDNPMVLDNGVIISGGNFHGEFPAKALDYLAIGVHEISNISETRVERLLNNHLSELPAFLVQEGGINSGFMIAQCTAAALVSENKTLCHPASVDSIPTSAEKEDHVSMGGWAARKCIALVQNVENVLAVELLCAVQAIDFLRPLTTTKPLEALYSIVRRDVAYWDKDRYMKPAIDKCAELIRSRKVIKAIADVFNENPSLPAVGDTTDPHDDAKHKPHSQQHGHSHGHGHHEHGDNSDSDEGSAGHSHGHGHGHSHHGHSHDVGFDPHTHTALHEDREH